MEVKEKIDLKTKIRSIPDFPIKGILFRDITTLLQDPCAFKQVIDTLTDYYKDKKIDAVAAIEARGYILGAPVAYNLGVGFIPIRKKGKLPAKAISKEYSLEYGTAILEMHEDAVQAGQNVLLIDDLIATGGSAKAAGELIKEAGAELAGYAFVIELVDLAGRELLKDHEVYTIIQY